MLRMRPLCTIAAILGSTAVIGSQAAPAAALSEAQRAHLKADRFQIVTSIRGLPLGVRDGLQALFAGVSLDRGAGRRVSGHRRARQLEAADPAAGCGGVLDRSLPHPLR